MRIMHNAHEHHASGEIAQSRFESLDHVCSYCREEECYCGRITVVAQPTCGQSGFQRARSMFQDDLLVRSPSGFELTLRGRKILQELEELLPKMESLVAPSVFDPLRERSTFRISGPDNVCAVVIPSLCRRWADGSHRVQFEFHPWQSGIAELIRTRAARSRSSH
jgi:hypothetical protein